MSTNRSLERIVGSNEGSTGLLDIRIPLKELFSGSPLHSRVLFKDTKTGIVYEFEPDEKGFITGEIPNGNYNIIIPGNSRRNFIENIGKAAAGIILASYIPGCIKEPVGPVSDTFIEWLGDTSVLVSPADEPNKVSGVLEVAVRGTNDEEDLEKVVVKSGKGFEASISVRGPRLTARGEMIYTGDDVGKDTYNMSALTVGGHVTERYQDITIRRQGYVNLSIDWKKILSQDPLVGGAARLLHLDSDTLFSFKSDSSGIIRERVPSGVYRPIFDGRGAYGDGSHASYVEVTDKIYPDPGQFIFEDKTRTVVVTGPGLANDESLMYRTWTRDPVTGVYDATQRVVRWVGKSDRPKDVYVEDLVVEEDLDLRVRTADSEEIMEKAGRQAGNTGLSVVNMRELHRILFNLGNDSYKGVWNVDPSFVPPDGGLNPPGVISPKDGQGRYIGEVAFDIWYYDNMLPIFNDKRFIGNPYGNVEVVKGYAEDIKQYLDFWSTDDQTPMASGNNILYIANSSLGLRGRTGRDAEVVGKEDASDHFSVWYNKDGIAIVSWWNSEGGPEGRKPGIDKYGTEVRAFGAVQRSFPNICSVRDEYRLIGQGFPMPCSTQPQSVLHPIDRDINLLFAAFGPASQVQLRKGLKYLTGPYRGEPGRGLNLWFLSPGMTEDKFRAWERVNKSVLPDQDYRHAV